MITINLNDIITNYQKGNNDLILTLLSKFNFLIKKLSNKLKYECAETDLTIYFIELIKSMDIEKFRNATDGAIVNYIHICLKRKTSYLYKSNLKFINETTEYNDDIKSIATYLETDILEIDSMLNCLNNTQKQIIIDKYIYKLTDIEISSKLKVSRQTIYCNKVKALNLLKIFYDLHFM